MILSKDIGYTQNLEQFRFKILELLPKYIFIGLCTVTLGYMLISFCIGTFSFYTNLFDYFLKNALLILLIIGFLGLFLVYNVSLNQVKAYSLTLSLILLILTIILAVYYQPLQLTFQYRYTLLTISAYDLALSFGIDGISLSFLLLTVIIFPICFLAS